MDNPSSHDLSRRTLIRNGLLASFGVTVAIAALTRPTGTALAENLDETVSISLTDDDGYTSYICQPDWWYCVNCYGMYHSDNDAAGGVCPAGGQHQNDTSYTNYSIPYGDTSSISAGGCGVQAGWRWCDRCQGLFWGNAAAESRCPAGGQHTAGSTTYDVPYGDPYQFTLAYNGQIIFAQSNWLYCGKCRGIFYGHGTTADGICPAGGTHSQYAGSSNYAMLPYIPE